MNRNANTRVVQSVTLLPVFLIGNAVTLGLRRMHAEVGRLSCRHELARCCVCSPIEPGGELLVRRKSNRKAL